ncbi:MAG: bifunctional glutamate N-acetyltransferase/amino-acid acetyltransferase ArgJ [Lachnospiraceae bacterium]|nr:bifunctional glutamate N-acetyltransferase/amino-acid acetyltransferase ArgJ [Lachnospiraceae bacterium]
MNIIEGGVTAPKGFAAASYAAGIKYEGRTDMALIYSDELCDAAGVYTSNVVKAAPVIWDRNITSSDGKVRAVVVNSGIANACTGEEGMNICKQTASAVAEVTGDKPENVLVGSTGVIGMQINVGKITAGAKELLKLKDYTLEAGEAASKAIMTTDTHNKQIAVTIEIDGVTCTIGAMCKGSGMIHPNMCTMLGYVCTDIKIEKSLLKKALDEVVVDTFNMISVDGDTSTNDTLLVLANGMAGNEIVNKEDANYQTFKDALYYVSEHLAKEMAGDGEGATALFEATVINAKTKDDARKLSKSIISSSLSKAAIYGHDANFGRFLCAMGYSGVMFDQNDVQLSFKSRAGEMMVFDKGTPLSFDEDEATKILSEDHVTVFVDMHEGNESATAWGCDLTYDYIKINADYRS